MGREANKIHRAAFEGIKTYITEWDENAKTCGEVRRQMSLPLEGK